MHELTKLQRDPAVSQLLRLPIRVLRFWIHIIAPGVFLRQLGALAVLIVLRRVLGKLRRTGNNCIRVLSALVSSRAQNALELRRARRKCKDYASFRTLGEALDKAEGLDKWKLAEESDLYNERMLKERTQKYADLKARGDVQGCMFALRGELLRKHFGTCNPALYHVTATGTKKLVEDYVSTVCETMTWAAFSHRDDASDGDNEDAPSVVQKLAFFNETKHSFGRSALLLSGGAALGMYHFGVVKALHRNALLPRIISGTSAGSIIAGCICTRTDDELLKFWADDFDWESEFNLNFFSDIDIGGFLRRGGAGLYSADYLGKALRDSIGDYTFLEAFDRTGHVLNISVSGLPGSSRLPMLLNYLTSPHVLIWSASLVSCSIPGIFEPGELLSKDCHGNIVPYVSAGLKWQDGSMQSDLPMTRLTELFNVNFFIVSQVNPQARIFSGGGVGRPSGLVFRHAQFLRRQIKQFLLSFSEFVLGTAGGRVSPYLRPVGFTPVGLAVQEYEGDVTIFNGAGMLAIPNLLSNGSNDKLRRMTAEAEWETWWFIPEIQNACAIEFTMDEIIKELRDELVSEKPVSQIPDTTPPGNHYSQLRRIMSKSDGLGRMPSFNQHVEMQLGQRTRISQKAKQKDQNSPRLVRRSSSRRNSGLLASNKSLLNLLTLAADSPGTN
eukprot:TRINITY_DN102179_c0_g1_i1.p1 TRINITY_DN102179_c0_g1~~TRINITY_DN102179_c0_g1_i1.p1  ORF type:complete len:669 (+),score=95.13 TRINITY_DN102179_c0_g1_i1:151-2157(+)